MAGAMILPAITMTGVGLEPVSCCTQENLALWQLLSSCLPFSGLTVAASLGLLVWRSTWTESTIKIAGDRYPARCQLSLGDAYIFVGVLLVW